jgi:hypothetical protein
MSFVLLMPRRPPSGNKPPNRRFQEALRAAAQARVGTQPLLEGNLFSRITWFHREKTTQDVDNLAKNIHDALKGIVFRDDVQIVQCLTGKIDATQPFAVAERTGPAAVIAQLYSLLSGEHEHVLCIEIGPVSHSRVVFGPIDGGTPL